ncbi:MAG: hypothetical protein COU64_01815 [Candidatus Pacebacteria bacterium CG10_big_fil_rev_8_21_14_0_10_40_26]|nr:MAG: hypothetical protein COU64_01815 [Candidatus Pacebacteria bacterium CG10_big_fil_rev_8_21_14_0_10_40_26]
MASKNYSKLLADIKKQEIQLEIQLEKMKQGLTNEHSATLQSSREQQSTEVQIRLDGLQKYFEMRSTWGDFLKICLAIILAFNIVLIVVVGIGWLKYNDEWFLRIVLTTNLADIIGLVYLVVKFLFSNQVEAFGTNVPHTPSS